MNEMRKWIDLMEAISAADVEAVKIPSIHDVGNWNRRDDVAMSFMELLRLMDKVADLTNLYDEIITERNLRGVGLELLRGNLAKIKSVTQLAYHHVNGLKENTMDRDPVLKELSDKFYIASKIVRTFYDNNITNFNKSALLNTPVEKFMDAVRYLYSSLLSVAQLLISFY